MKTTNRLTNKLDPPSWGLCAVGCAALLHAMVMYFPKLMAEPYLVDGWN